jgi:hypothetical protein
MPLTFQPRVLADATTALLLANDAGGRVYVPDLTANCTITLPPPAMGLWFEIVYAGVAADAQNWILSADSATHNFIGGVVHLDTDANSAGDEIVVVSPNGSTNAKLTVTRPEPGTRVTIECTDGVHWCVNGMVSSITAPAFADLP